MAGAVCVVRDAREETWKTERTNLWRHASRELVSP
jgi:hypothetical protein